jgi:hAT family C-terminal dimerisation region
LGIFIKYYVKANSSALYAAALILRPNYNIQYIKENCDASSVSSILEMVEKLWETYRDKNANLVSVLSNTIEERLPERELDMFDQIAQGLKKYSRPSSQDEYRDYTCMELYDIREVTALEWWSQDRQRKRWPRLSLMAFDILSVPAMSDEAERVFSEARRTISWDRSQLSPETIEAVECLKHWKQNGILNEILDKSS